MEFSNTTDGTGIYELFQELTKTNTDSFSKARFAQRANSAFAKLMLKAIKASQKFQVDDTNQEDYPMIDINIVSGQRDYALTTDDSTIPNQILDITRIELKTPSGQSILLNSFDQTDTEQSLVQMATQTGTPNRYDKLANGIFLDPVPNYNYTAGMRVYFHRNPVFFTSTDTTKTPGIPYQFHEYMAYLPAYQYAIIHLPELAGGYLQLVKDMEKEVASYYYFRNKDERKAIKPRVENTK